MLINFFHSFRINKGEVEAEFARQVKKVRVAKVDTLKQEDLKTQMEDFLKVRMPPVGAFVHLNGRLHVLIYFSSHLGSM